MNGVAAYMAAMSAEKLVYPINKLLDTYNRNIFKVQYPQYKPSNYNAQNSNLDIEEANDNGKLPYSCRNFSIREQTYIHHTL